MSPKIYLTLNNVPNADNHRYISLLSIHIYYNFEYIYLHATNIGIVIMTSNNLIEIELTRIITRLLFYYPKI